MGFPINPDGTIDYATPAATPTRLTDEAAGYGEPSAAATAKTHPLEVDELTTDGGAIYSLYSKGHHEASEFLQECREYLKDQWDDIADEIVSPSILTEERVTHFYGRWSWEWYDGDRVKMMREYKSRGRGRFPVTQIIVY